MPAAFTTPSIPPMAVAPCLTARATDTSCVTSASAATPPVSRATSASLLRSQSSKVRKAPSAANSSAVRRPIPDAAPVIRIRRPWRRAECVADIGLCRLRFSIHGFDIIDVLLWRPAWAVVGVVWQHSNRCLDREAGSAGTAGAASFTYAGKNSDRGAVSVAPIASASVRRDTDDLPSGAVRPGCAASTRLSAYSKGACRLRAKEPHTLLMNLVHLLLCRVIYGHALQILLTPLASEDVNLNASLQSIVHIDVPLLIQAGENY